MKESSMIFTMDPILGGLADAWYSVKDREVSHCFEQFYERTWSCNRRKETVSYNYYIIKSVSNILTVKFNFPQALRFRLKHYLFFETSSDFPSFSPPPSLSGRITSLLTSLLTGHSSSLIALLKLHCNYLFTCLSPSPGSELFKNWDSVLFNSLGIPTACQCLAHVRQIINAERKKGGD